MWLVESVTASREAISSVLGYSSIVAWLFAQAPQVLENYRNGSVEGLALPFLVSWLCGDATNLIGCVLTHQLPFQTYLATYFVGIDVILMSQYVYYSRKNPIHFLPPLSEAFPHAQAEIHCHHHHDSNDRRRSRRREKVRRTRSKGLDSEEDLLAQSWMSESSAGHSPSSSRPRHSGRSSRFLPSRQNSSTHILPANASSSVASLEPPSPTTEEPRGRTLARPSRGVVPVLETISGSPASGSPVPFLHHARFELRGEAEMAHEQHQHRSQRNTSSNSRSRPPAPSRRTSMLFLSVGALVTFSTWSGQTRRATETLDVGSAWSTTPEALPIGQLDRRPMLHPPVLNTAPSIPPLSRRARRQIYPVSVSVGVDGDERHSYHPSSVARNDVDVGDEQRSETKESPPRQRDLERFIGRAAAWLCTTLYLTSRLPQIWQNFRRRSVEGLSMLLFLMAFIGNSLYTASILTNPHATEPGYILESLPYLLGSGGTVCFDLTILTQSFLYSDKRKVAMDRIRRRKCRHTLVAEEEAALLDSDLEEDVDTVDEGMTDDGASTAGRASRRSRSVSTSRQTASLTRSKSSRRSERRGILKRSGSTEMGRRKTSSRSSSRDTTRHAHVVEDGSIDWRHEDLGAEGMSDGRTSASTSRSRTRPSSVASVALGNIQEVGESAFNLRA